MQPSLSKLLSDISTSGDGSLSCLSRSPLTNGMSSRPAEFHLRALPEPCMTLSSHTAPDVRPLLERLCLVHGLLPFPVGQWPRPNNAAPSLQPHYRTFLATTGCSAPALRIGTLALAVGAACGFSLHAFGVTEHRFSRSVRKPGRASRRLHAGCRSDSLRHPPSSSRSKGHPPVLASPKPLSTLLRRFACARLSQPCLPESCPGVSATLATTTFDRSGLRWLEIST